MKKKSCQKLNNITKSTLTKEEITFFTWPSEKFQLMQLNKSQKWNEIGLIDDSEVKLTKNYIINSNENNNKTNNDDDDDDDNLTSTSKLKLFIKNEYRIVTAIAPPFIQETTKMENSTYPCLTGVPCLKVSLKRKKSILFCVTFFLTNYY